jgi:uncharacterized protein YneF (UPF0154 family)
LFFLTFSNYPSEAGLASIAAMTTQVSGILLGFWAVGIFYFLATINSRRDQLIETEARLTVRMEQRGFDFAQSFSNTLGAISHEYAQASDYMIRATMLIMGCFAGAVFLMMFSVITSLNVPLVIGLGFLVGGIIGMVLAIRDTQRFLDALATFQTEHVTPLIAQIMAIAEERKMRKR